MSMTSAKYRLRSGILVIQAHGELVGLATLLVGLPFILPYEALACNVLIFGLFASGFNLTYGQLGLLSFGHAVMFGAGAYTAGVASLTFGLQGVPYLALAAVAGALAGGAMGTIVARLRGIYLSMVTLALTQCAYFACLQTADYTGGENGLRGIGLSSFHLLGMTFDFDRSISKYYVLLFIALLVLLLLNRVMQSAFGLAMEAVREDELRARSCGYHSGLVKMLAFAISGGICGLAGGMLSAHLGVANTELLSIRTSSTVILILLLGGARTLIGPFLGATVLLVAEDVMSTYTEHWQLLVGTVFIACVTLLPGGFASLIRPTLRRAP